MPIDLYYMIESPPSRTVLMVAKLLDIELNLKSLDLSKGQQMDGQFVALNPCHCVPTLVDNELVLWESRAIVTYLVNQYKPSHPLYPTDPKTRATVDKLLQLDLGTIYRSISSYVTPLFFGGSKLNQLNDNTLKESLDLFDSMLNNENQFVCGNDLSLADISIIAGFSLLEAIDYRLNDWTHIHKWIDRVKDELKDCYEEINGKAVENTREYIKRLTKTEQK